MRIHVRPSWLDLVKSSIETFTPQQIGQEDASRTLDAGFALHLHKRERVSGDGLRIDVLKHAMRLHETCDYITAVLNAAPCRLCNPRGQAIKPSGVLNGCVPLPARSF
jgi:hypothetical protein